MAIYRSNLNRLERVWEHLFHSIRLPKPYIPSRKYLYDAGLFKRHESAAWVISIGGLEVGGSGKTPVILWLLTQLSEFRVAVLHSGYGGGDEARLIRAKYPDVFVWADKRRHLGLQAAQAWGAEIILLDDGFQCHRIRRDCDIVVVDAGERLSQQNLLPFGRLRESPIALERAQLIIANHTQNLEIKSAFQAEAQSYSTAPIVFVKPKLPPIPKVPSAVFCGLGKSKHFLSALEQQDLDVRAQLLLSDHQTPPKKLWKQFLRSCLLNQVEQIVCTEKDFHRFPMFDSPVPIKPVSMTLEVV